MPTSPNHIVKISAGINANLKRVLAFHDGKVVGKLVGVFNIDIWITTAQACKLALRIDGTREVECNAGETLQWKRKQRNVIFLGEIHTQRSESGKTSVLPRVAGARFIHNVG